MLNDSPAGEYFFLLSEFLGRFFCLAVFLIRIFLTINSWRLLQG